MAILIAGWCTSVHAQSDQTFRVRVPGLISINASNHFEQIFHDETDNDQVFDWQYWQVVCNNPTGALLTFETDQCFTHTDVPSVKRNVQLDLRKNGAKKWKLGQKKDTTDYANGDEVASVTADTDRASDGEFRLQVTFIEESFADTLEGDYELTVTGTIVAK